MKIKNDVLDPKVLSTLPSATVVGIDIGSRQSKAVLLHDGWLFHALIPTGFQMQETADELLDILTEEAGIERRNIAYLVSTGYGRIALKFSDIPNQLMTEISCHGFGAHLLDARVQTIIDIGGQDSKAIRIDPETGKVAEFAMNDKCAAGTGRFLEKIAEALGYDVTKIGAVALESDAPMQISSQCVVFAESEVISARAAGKSTADIAAGIHLSVAKRVRALVGKVGLEPEILFTGGVSNNVGMRRAFEELLQLRFLVPKLDTVYAGALGAAGYAARLSAVRHREETQGGDFEISLDNYEKALKKARTDFSAHQTGKSFQAAYLCAYTPVELLAASGAAYLRLMEAGSQKEVMAGETYTQSVFCDITKSVIGGFATNNPLYTSIDHVYSFYACECMRKSTEVIRELYAPADVYNLPRKRRDPNSREYMVREVEAFRRDLEEEAHREITEQEIREKIRLYNLARKYLREISAYRKAENPLLSGREFRKLSEGYFTLPVEELLTQLSDVQAQLQKAKPRSGKKVRLMLAGGMVAHGDDKVVDIIERDLDAVVVAEDNCTGLKPLSCEVREEGNVFEDLADGYLDQPPCFRMQPVADAVAFSVDLAKEYRVDGVVFYYLKFCPCSSIVVQDYIDRFQEENIPLMILSGDYSGGDIGQLRTRLEAFVEVLREKNQDSGGELG